MNLFQRERKKEAHSLSTSSFSPLVFLSFIHWLFLSLSRTCSHRSASGRRGREEGNDDDLVKEEIVTTRNSGERKSILLLFLSHSLDRKKKDSPFSLPLFRLSFSFMFHPLRFLESTFCDKLE